MMSRVVFGGGVLVAFAVGMSPLLLGEGFATASTPRAQLAVATRHADDVRPAVEGESTATETTTPTETTTVTDTSTETTTVTDTATETATVTDTSTATETATSTATDTATVTETSTEMATSTATQTATSTATDTATVTDTATATETATDTTTETDTKTAASPTSVTDTSTSTSHTAAPVSTAPTAAFTWLPQHPRAGAAVSLLSTSSAGSSPLSSFAWRIGGKGAFAVGSAARSVTFSQPGAHQVTLRVTAANGETDASTATISVASSEPTLMEPFPVVDVGGTYSGDVADLRVLDVQAPAGATIAVSCSGNGCPAHLQRRRIASGRGDPTTYFHRFEQTLPAGTIIEVKVFATGKIGKLTRLVVRRGKPIQRTDTCLSPNGRRAVSCPS